MVRVLHAQQLVQLGVEQGAQAFGHHLAIEPPGQTLLLPQAHRLAVQDRRAGLAGEPVEQRRSGCSRCSRSSSGA